MASTSALGGWDIPYLSEVRGFSRQTKRFLLAEALLMASTGGIFGVLHNLYLSRLGFGEDFIGQFNSLGALGMATFSIPAAVISDRLGHKRGFLISCLAQAFFSLGLALSTYGPFLLVLNFFSSALKAMFWVNAAPFLATHSLPRQRTSLFALRYTIMQVSSMLGSFCGGLLPPAFRWAMALSPGQVIAPFRYSLLVGAGLTFCSFLRLVALRIEPVDEPAMSLSQARQPEGSALGSMWALLVILGLVSGARGGTQQALNYFFNVYLDKVHGLPTSQIGLTYALAQGASCAATLFIAPVLARRLGLRRAMGVSLWSIVAFPLLIGLVPLAPIAVLGYVASMVTLNVNKPLFADLSMGSVPQRLRVRTAGATMTGWSMMAALAGVAGGYLILWAGFDSIFFLSGTFALSGVAIYQLYLRKIKPLGASPEGASVPHCSKG